MIELKTKFNCLTKQEYFYVIEHHKEYYNFNTLGLYRSIIENPQLSNDDRLEVLSFANQFFQKFFDFLVIKDPWTYERLYFIGQHPTSADRLQLLADIRDKQQKILKTKKIKHRNFGYYAKHNCGNENCPYNGIMVKQGKFLCDGSMWFKSDKPVYRIRKKDKKANIENKEFNDTIKLYKTK